MTQLATNGRGLAVMQPDSIDRGDPGQPVVRYTIGDMEQIAKRTAASGLFAMSEHQVFTLMLLCEAEGLHPIQALRRFDIIEGKPALKAAAIQAEFQRHGGKITWVERSNEACAAEFSHPRLHPEPITVRIALQDLIDNEVALGKWDERERKRVLKANYRRHPRSMLSARVVSEGVRAIDPGIVIGLYTPEEVEDMRDESAGLPGPSPSPRRSELRAALDDARRPAASPQPEPGPTEEAPAKVEFRPWLEARLAALHEQWCEIAKNDEIDPGKPIPPEQVTNHLISAWITDGTLDEARILGARGTRDKAKARAVLADAWDRDPEGVIREIDEYLKAKLVEQAAAAGLSAAGDAGTPGPEPAGFALGQ